ncbi:glycosyltransferase family 39 protein [Roseomonas sp. HJA6]|uniref:Glycosyltransferase family 39 protein n=1 Tax=Roseomonas alba TaxID=2846776 RepID=A0ABS7ABV3_9PROT|nr:glycosyltransferase family 39 protein [Neoroseomonas alba]MBW6399779.1 glycosyltransferase family 39 protein [Neoroseomonas alba]
MKLFGSEENIRILNILREIPGKFAWLGLMICVASAFAYGPWLLSMKSYLIMGFAIGSLLVMFIYSRFLKNIDLGRMESGWKTWSIIIFVGAGLRILWAVLVDPVYGGDAISFHETALRILSEHRYASTYQDVLGIIDRQIELRSWRPPGLPVMLACWYFIFGHESSSVIAFNIFVYVMTSLILIIFCVRLFNRGGVSVVLAVFALWPKLIILGSVPLTEAPSLLLFLISVLAFDRFLRGSLPSSVGAGLAFGVGALVRPSMLLMPLAWGAMAAASTRVSLRRGALVLAGATIIGMACVLPWSLRNQAVLGEFVLISTNGGDVLYRANNPRATGNFTPAGERDLTQFITNEAEWNKLGSAWAVEWILENPTEFLKSAIRKLGYFWGAGEDGNTFRLYYPDMKDRFPLIVLTAEILMNFSWFLLLFAVGGSLVAIRGEIITSPLLVGLMWGTLLLSGVHAVYESHARYNLPILGALILIAASGPMLSRSGTSSAQ